MTWRLWLADAVKALLLGAADRPADRGADPVADGRGRRLVVAVGLGRLDGASTCCCWWSTPPSSRRCSTSSSRWKTRRCKARVTALMQRCGFAAKGLFVMDGSTRSAHANAYFTGFGAAKRVVFYDTLLRQAHRRAKSTPCWRTSWATSSTSTSSSASWRMFAMSLAGFALLGWLSTQRLVLHRPGRAAQPRGRPTTRWRCCCSCWRCRCSPSSSRRCWRSFSRKHEFEADAYAVAQTSGARPGQRAAQALRGQRLDAHARPGVREVLLLAPAGVRAAGAHGSAGGACMTTHAEAERLDAGRRAAR